MTTTRKILILTVLTPVWGLIFWVWTYVADPAYLGLGWGFGLVATGVALVLTYFFGVLSREPWETARN